MNNNQYDKCISRIKPGDTIEFKCLAKHISKHNIEYYLIRKNQFHINIVGSPYAHSIKTLKATILEVNSHWNGNKYFKFKCNEHILNHYVEFDGQYIHIAWKIEFDITKIY